MAANTNFAVAVHGLAVLAYTKALTTSDFVASSINTNPVVVRRVLGRLGRAGLVRSTSGKNGGFELARPAAKIRLVDVLHAVDDGALFRIHNNDENPHCPVSCGIKEVLAEVMDRVDVAVERELSKTSLADVVRAAS
jgi:Rrf2 family protein